MAHVTVWNEHRVEHEVEQAAVHYPEGIHTAVVTALAEHGLHAEAATLDDPHQGLADERLDATDVLVWWGHRAHDEVDDARAERVAARVRAGMGLVVLHSGHLSKPFLRLHGTSGRLRWRHDDVERLWIIEPDHPIADGLPEVVRIEPEEMYGERFDVPPPDELVAVSSFGGGEVFRSVCTWRRGAGRLVYVRPGDEHYPTYHQPEVRRLVANAVRWAQPAGPAPRGAQ
jgi:trehalose utilization protein